MKISRVAALTVLVSLTFAALPAQAQSGLPSRLEALELRVAKLEAGQVTAAGLVGTYAFYVFGTFLSADGPAAEITSEMTVGSITLNADGTASATIKDSGYNLSQGNPWSRSYFESFFSEDVTWSLVNGTLVIPGAFEATVGAGGRVLIAGGTGLKGDGWNNLGLLIRVPNP